MELLERSTPTRKVKQLKPRIYHLAAEYHQLSIPLLVGSCTTRPVMTLISLSGKVCSYIDEEEIHTRSDCRGSITFNSDHLLRISVELLKMNALHLSQLRYYWIWSLELSNCSTSTELSDSKEKTKASEIFFRKKKKFREEAWDCAQGGELFL